MRVSPAPPHAAGNNPPHTPHSSSHMSPAVGGPGSVVMPPIPGSGQSDSRNSSSMHAPGYPPGAPPHMSGAPPGSHVFTGKMGHMPPGPPGPPYGQPYQQGPPGHQYPPSRPPGPMMQPYPQNFPPGGPQQGPPGGPPSSMPPSQQYPPRQSPHNNHVPSQPYGYPPFGHQSWGSQGMNHGPPGGPGMMPSSGQNMPGSKGAPGQPGQPGGPNSVGGPRPHTPPHPYLKHGLPPHKMGGPGYPGGPQMYPNGPGQGPGGMPPGMPGMGNNRDAMGNNMPPPTTTPQPLTPNSQPMESEHGVGPPSNNSNPPPIGPDGNPLVDEASQQSTVSNTSAASGDDRSGTPGPKSHKDGGPMGGGLPGGMPGQHPSLQGTVHNSAPSPGAASMTSQQDDLESINSPGWPRSPNTQTVYANSQAPPPTPDIYRPTKGGESIARLYEMSDSPERRSWLDKLLMFMDDNKTPITACPTISKNPLDLYALYLHVRERGGFLEVTKNKQWKDVAAVMGIGASSSGSYTLRKHYMKHILAFECKFDRGGIDPQPIITQIENAAKKKTTKTISVPSPGSSNSQDSFPAAGSNSSSMDGFSNGPHGGGPGMGGPYTNYQPNSGEYGGHMGQRPPSGNPPGYQGQYPGQYPGYHGMQGGYGGQGGFPNNYQGPPGPGPNHQGQYPGYNQPGGFQRPPFPPSQSGGYQQDPNYPGYPQGSNMYPPQQGKGTSPGPGPQPNQNQYGGPRRHPDFEKNQPPGWRGGNNQFPGYPSGPGGPGSGQWGNQPPSTRPNDSSGGPPNPGPGGPPPNWTGQQRFPGPQTPFSNQPNRWGSSYNSSVGSRPPGPGDNRKGGMPGSPGMPGAPGYKAGGMYSPFVTRQQFPLDSVEAVLPVLARRKRMSRADLPVTDPWRLLMSLRCGLASEVTWALDIINILLFDDTTVVYFGLHHMPGLLEALIEHLRRGLINMFDICSELELGSNEDATGANKRVKAEQNDSSDRPWYLRPPPSPTLELDLGMLDDEDPTDKETILQNNEDFTLISKTGKPVKFVKKDGELFLRGGTRDWDKWEGYNSGIDTWSVGGGECTAHIICSMEARVPTIPFTRLLPGSRNTYGGAKITELNDEDMEVKMEKGLGDKTVNEKSNVKKVKLAEEKNTIVKVKEEKDEESIENLKSKDSKISENSLKFNKINNAKSSKLDDILSRIKKEPELVISKDKISSGEGTKMCSDKNVDVKDETNTKNSDESENSMVVDRPVRLERRTSSGSRRESGGFKRPYDDLEEESWSPDEASLSTTTEGQDWLARRVMCVGTVIRNLSFIPGNEDVMGNSASLLALLGKTILLHHEHPLRCPSTAHYDRDEEADLSDWCSSLAPDTHWWWPYLHHVHENTLVTLANISCNLDLSAYPEEISRPLINGLLHWATCPASYGQDPLPGGGTSAVSALSPQRLALEVLVKLCVLDQNTDLVLATPPFSRLDSLCGQLTRFSCRGEDQVLREFSINLLHYFSAADSGVARVIAMQNGCVSLLVSFIEEAESAAMNVANIQGVSALKENPELMGTSLDMVRRAANTLVHLSRVPANSRILSACENRLLTLVMSQILDTYVASQLSQVLFNVAQVQHDTPPGSPVTPTSSSSEQSTTPTTATTSITTTAVTTTAQASDSTPSQPISTTTAIPTSGVTNKTTVKTIEPPIKKPVTESSKDKFEKPVSEKSIASATPSVPSTNCQTNSNPSSKTNCNSKEVNHISNSTESSGTETPPNSVPKPDNNPVALQSVPDSSITTKATPAAVVPSPPTTPSVIPPTSSAAVVPSASVGSVSKLMPVSVAPARSSSPAAATVETTPPTSHPPASELVTSEKPASLCQP
ncbi:unnamed protein product, partial [Meganyctiphanes norvegica]